MTKQRKVYIHYDLMNCTGMFKSRGWGIADRLAEADIILFAGGADISPDLYQCLKHSATSPSLHRDNLDLKAWDAAREKDIPCVGICRGHQFLHAMNGGVLYQDVTDHTSSHEVKDVLTGQKFISTSIHHQSCDNPAWYGGEVLLTAVHAKRKDIILRDGTRITSHATEADPDIEAFWYPETKCFGVQGHPECAKGSVFQDWFFLKIHQLCLGEL